jgi:hypothetical protein
VNIVTFIPVVVEQLEPERTKANAKTAFPAKYNFFISLYNFCIGNTALPLREDLSVCHAVRWISAQIVFPRGCCGFFLQGESRQIHLSTRRVSLLESYAQN